MEPSLEAKLGFKRWGRKKCRTYFMWANKQGTKQSELLQAVHRATALMVRQKLLQECQTDWTRRKYHTSCFLPRHASKWIRKMRESKSGSEKVQVRAKLAGIVSISPTGFVRFKCGTRLAGRSEIPVNYSQRDPHGKWEYKSTSIKPTFFHL